MRVTDKTSQTLTADEREQRELKIWRDFCHALIEGADLGKLRRTAHMMCEDLKNCSNAELKILRKAVVSMLEISNDRQVKKVARVFADHMKAEREEDQKLYKDLRELTAEGYVSPIQ
jgi:hypothetical protein